MVRIVDFVDEALIGLFSGAVFGGGPDTWSTATGVDLEVGS